MAVSRAGKLLLGLFFVWTFIPTTEYQLFAAQNSSEGETETLTPVPADDNSGQQESATEDTNIASGSCDDSSCSFEGVPLCSPPGRIWVRSDWLLWWTNGSHIPPLATTSPQGTPISQAGVLGLPGTTVLYGDSTIFDGSRPGVRLSIGGWLDACHRWGVEGDWFNLGGQSANYFQSSDGNPILARPFFNLQTLSEDRQLKAYPNTVSGALMVNGKDYFESVGANLRYNLCCNSCSDICEDSCETSCGECQNPCKAYYCRTDFLMGYRRYSLGDSLAIHENIFDSRVSSRFQITDSFIARNEFDGGELGLSTELRRGRWSLGLTGKMALGNTHQTVVIDGVSVIDNGAVTATYGTGILATQSNIGTYNKDVFTVIPQFNVEVGYQLTCRCRTYLGYNFLYWAPVQRAGEQIDLNVDTRNWAPVQAGALPYPAYQAKCTNFWAQGINLGAEIRF